MQAQALTFRKTNNYKNIFLGISAVLLLLIISGSVYVANEPALSLRALYEDARGLALSAFWTPYRNTPPSSDATARGIPVLTYHRLVSDASDVNNVSIGNFQDQMLALKKAGWQTVSLADFEAFMRGQKVLPEKSFLLTFDDAAKESYYPVDPVLKALNYQAVDFVIVASSEIPRTTYYLSPKELQEMLASGRWSIGSHSFDGHRPSPVDAQGDNGVFFADRIWIPEENRLETTQEFAERVTNDLTHAKKELEETYKVPINSFAFPLGNETGIAGANNYPEGAAKTAEIARGVYSFGFLQLNRQQFTNNFPIFSGTANDIPSETAKMLGSTFEVRRIHVDHDWDSAHLLSILENARTKRLPFEDDFTQDNGWITSWGKTDVGRNNFVLTSDTNSDSALTFLDGSELWGDYSFDAAVNWTGGDVFVLGDVVNSKNYDSCVFSPGHVKVQMTKDGIASTVSEKDDPNIALGNNVRVGIRVHGTTIECAWNFGSIAEAYTRTNSGGVGLMVSNAQTRNASLQVSSIIARPLGSDTQNAVIMPETQTQQQPQTQTSVQSQKPIHPQTHPLPLPQPSPVQTPQTQIQPQPSLQQEEPSPQPNQESTSAPPTSTEPSSSPQISPQTDSQSLLELRLQQEPNASSTAPTQ